MTGTVIRFTGPPLPSWVTDSSCSNAIVEYPKTKMADEPTEGTDPVLLTFLQATDDRESQGLLTDLLTRHAQPVSQGIIRRKLHDSRQALDAEDIYGEIRLRLLRQLRHIKENPSERLIHDFRRYVAAITYHAWEEYLRGRYPRRAHLKNRIRYLLTRRGGFALWRNDNNEWICGLSHWREKTAAIVPGARKGALDRLLWSIFETMGRPIELDRLVSMAAESLGLREIASQEDLDQRVAKRPWESSPGARMNKVEQRLYLAGLWEQIRQLPVRQRTAVLLNLKDSGGRSAIELFHLLGISTVREIAAVLQMSALEFARLWNQLPLEDKRIAELLGVTRQQVINLRKAARERLRRWATSHES